MSEKRRIVCAWLPYWPMEVWSRAQLKLPRGNVPSDHPNAPALREVAASTSCPSRRDGTLAGTEGSGATGSHDRGFVLVVTTARGDVVHAVDDVAAALGVAPGQRATDVMAIHRGLEAVHADPEAEAASLDRLAAWMRRWSPHVRPDGVDGVALDATGCAHLFGGEAEMLRAIEDRLAALGVTARLAMAPTHGAAHALARHSAAPGRPVVVDDWGLYGALAQLPVAALRIDPASVTLLRRLGLATVGQLAAIPRPALKKRFGARRKRRDPRDDTWDDYLGRATGASADVLARLDEALGRVAVPLDPDHEALPFRIARGLPEAVMQTDTVLAATRPLVDDLTALLEEQGRGVRTFVLEAFRVDGGRSRTVLRLSRPTRDGGHLMRLLIDRLDGWHAEFGYEALAVEAPETAPLAPTQDDTENRSDAPDPHELIDRLRTRLGSGAVLRAVPRASHWPERAEEWVPAGETNVAASGLSLGRVKTLVPAGSDGPVAWTDAGGPTPLRPERLLDAPETIAVIHAVPDGPPARFTWRRITHDVALVSGPERIAPEWWCERSTARSRDYWRVETREGRRLWLFREGFEGDEREGAPRWFCHGLFA